jgi:hypothetical protein
MHYVLAAEDVALPPGEYRWDRFAERVGPRPRENPGRAGLSVAFVAHAAA